MRRTVNMLLVVLSIIGGIVGFVFGELLLHMLPQGWPSIIKIGLYFGVLALCIGLACLVAELIAPHLNGASWKLRYSTLSWTVLVPSTLVLLFVAGLALEFVYEIKAGSATQVKDIVLVIDNSGSMKETDPDNERYAAAKNLVGRMNNKSRVAVLSFDSEVEVVKAFTDVSSQARKNEVNASIDSMETTDGGTDIGLALAEAMKQIQAESKPGHGTMVILLSDGFSEVDLSASLAAYKQSGVVVNTVGLNLVDSEGITLLKDIAKGTGGHYYDVLNAGGLSPVFQSIYDKWGSRTLITEDENDNGSSAYYAVMRVMLMLIIGAVIGLSLGFVFDNRFLAVSFGTGGAIAGLLAGLILQLGLTGHAFGDGFTRLVADVVLAGVLSLSPLLIPVKEKQRASTRGRRPDDTNGSGGRQRRGNSSTLARPREEGNHGF